MSETPENKPEEQKGPKDPFSHTTVRVMNLPHDFTNEKYVFFFSFPDK